MGPKKNNYKVKLKIGDAEVEVEGAESGVVKIVQSLSEVLRGGAARSALNPAVSITSFAPSAAVLTAPRAVSDIRSFFEDKSPSSDIEAAAVAAYYYQYLAPDQTRRESIDSASLQEAFRMARRPLPARTAYTLINARNAGYLDSAGEGEFRLNPVGYNLVEHGLGSSAGEAEKKPAKRRKRQGKKQGK